jgi:hypothetical protein
MRLTKARVRKYRSIRDTGYFEVESAKTILVGPNEAGKSALLQALQQLNPPPDIKKFDALRDYPRSEYNDITTGKVKPAQLTVVEGHFALEPEDQTIVPEEFRSCAMFSEDISTTAPGIGLTVVQQFAGTGSCGTAAPLHRFPMPLCPCCAAVVTSSFQPYRTESPARSRGCYCCECFRGRFYCAHVLCERDARKVVGEPLAGRILGCVRWAGQHSALFLLTFGLPSLSKHRQAPRSSVTLGSWSSRARPC